MKRNILSKRAARRLANQKPGRRFGFGPYTYLDEAWLRAHVGDLLLKHHNSKLIKAHTGRGGMREFVRALLAEGYAVTSIRDNCMVIKVSDDGTGLYQIG